MLVWSVSVDQLRAAADAVGVDITQPEPRGRALSFRLALGADRSLYQRRGHSGRKVAAVCWHGHRDFMRALFAIAPDARLKSALADYRGVNEFERNFIHSDRAYFGNQLLSQMCFCGDRAVAAAEALGADYGRAVGSWIVDGNSSEETCRRLLEGITDGDPGILDSLPGEPLAGTWADDPTPSSVLADLGVDEDDDWSPDCLDAYEQAFRTAVVDTVESDCRRALGLAVA